MQLLIQTPRVVRRLDAERQAFRALEATLESLRASGGPAGDEKMELSEFNTAAGARAPKDLTVEVEVKDGRLPGLHHATLTAHYTVLGVAYTKRLETMFWR
jgi:hypothetical protein